MPVPVLGIPPGRDPPRIGGPCRAATERSGRGGRPSGAGSLPKGPEEGRPLPPAAKQLHALDDPGHVAHGDEALDAVVHHGRLPLRVLRVELRRPLRVEVPGCARAQEERLARPVDLDDARARGGRLWLCCWAGWLSRRRLHMGRAARWFWRRCRETRGRSGSGTDSQAPTSARAATSRARNRNRGCSALTTRLVRARAAKVLGTRWTST